MVSGGVLGCWGACMVAGGVWERVWLLGGHAWLQGGSMCGFGGVWLQWGVCMVAGAYMVVGGMHGCEGHAWLWGGMCGCRGHAWL